MTSERALQDRLERLLIRINPSIKESVKRIEALLARVDRGLEQLSDVEAEQQ